MATLCDLYLSGVRLRLYGSGVIYNRIESDAVTPFFSRHRSRPMLKPGRLKKRCLSPVLAPLSLCLFYICMVTVELSIL